MGCQCSWRLLLLDDGFCQMGVIQNSFQFVKKFRAGVELPTQFKTFVQNPPGQTTPNERRNQDIVVQHNPHARLA